jgi:hypothetical protein
MSTHEEMLRANKILLVCLLYVMCHVSYRHSRRAYLRTARDIYDDDTVTKNARILYDVLEYQVMGVLQYRVCIQYSVLCHAGTGTCTR